MESPVTPSASVPTPTDSATTESPRALSLLATYAEAVQPEAPWYEDPDLLIHWLLSRQREVTKSTFRKYRQWLAAYAESVERPTIAAMIRAAGKEETKRQVTSLADGSDVKGARRKAAAEMKESDLNLLMGQLMGRTKSGSARYETGLIAAAMVRTSMMTGFRPSEWHRAQILRNVPVPGKEGETYRHVLHVVGAAKGKIKEGRVRRLVLDAWDDAHIETLGLFLAELPSDPAQYRALQEQIRVALRCACRRAFGDPSRITLYTARHVFATELRRVSTYTRYDIAAMLGHHDTLNQRHYGKRRPTDNRKFRFPLPHPFRGEPDAVLETDRERYQLIYGKQTAAMLERIGAIEPEDA